MTVQSSAALLPEWALAFGVSGLLGIVAFLRRSLTTTGALAACFVGGTVWMGMGRGGFVVLCVFFLTSTLLGRVAKGRKQQFETHYSKGHRRDALQVLANGGVAAACGLLLWWQRHLEFGSSGSGLATVLGVAGCASLASANADTWATELGVLSSRPPWHLVKLTRVPPGTSGAVSALGLGVSWVGACVVAVTALLLDDRLGINAALMIAIGGFSGAAIDSVLGATLQRQYTCVKCGEQVEAEVHCGAPAAANGPRWAALNNDAVNLLANATAASIAALGVVG